MSRLAFIYWAFLLSVGLSASSSVGLSHQIGSKQKAASGTKEGRESVSVVLRLALRQGGALPSIAGDFTNWTAVRMTRYEKEWRFPVSLAPGVYYFAFRGKDGKWFVPAGFPNRADDGMGGWVAVLVVQ